MSEPKPGEAWCWQEDIVGREPVPIDFNADGLGGIPGVFNPRPVEWFQERGKFLCEIPKPEELEQLRADAEKWRNYVRSMNADD